MRGSRLLTASNKVLTENSVSFLGQTNCGYEGCASSCVNSLQEQLHELSDMIPCSNRSYEHDLVLEEGIVKCDTLESISIPITLQICI